MKKTKQTIGHYYGEKVKKYYQIVKEESANRKSGVDSNVFEYLEKVLPKNLKGKIALDIGCGDGRWSEYLCGLGAEKVIGLDISQDMIALARQRKKKSKLKNLQLIQADMQRMPLRKESIDMALATFSLMYFENLEEVLAEIGRVLKNKGQLYIATNVIVIKNASLLKKLQGQTIPIELGRGDKKIHLENLVQPLRQYKEGFKKAGLTIKEVKYFAPTKEVSVGSNYKYKDKIILKKVVFELIKKIK